MYHGLLPILAFAACLPLFFSIYVLLRKGTLHTGLPKWRRSLWHSGMILALAISLTPPLSIVSNFVPSSYAERFLVIYAYWVFGSFVCAPLSMLLLAFGEGKSRWLGVWAPVISAPILIVQMLAMTSFF